MLSLRLSTCRREAELPWGEVSASEAGCSVGSRKVKNAAISAISASTVKDERSPTRRALAFPGRSRRPVPRAGRFLEVKAVSKVPAMQVVGHEAPLHDQVDGEHEPRANPDDPRLRRGHEQR